MRDKNSSSYSSKASFSVFLPALSFLIVSLALAMAEAFLFLSSIS